MDRRIAGLPGRADLHKGDAHAIARHSLMPSDDEARGIESLAGPLRQSGRRLRLDEEQRRWGQRILVEREEIAIRFLALSVGRVSRPVDSPRRARLDREPDQPCCCSYPPHVLSLRQRLASSRAKSMKS